MTIKDMLKKVDTDILKVIDSLESIEAQAQQQGETNIAGRVGMTLVDIRCGDGQTDTIDLPVVAICRG